MLRVLLANLPRLLVQVLRDLVDRQPDMRVVGEARTLAELATAITSARPEAVVVGVPAVDLRRSVGALHDRNPALTVLGVTPCADRAVVWAPGASPRPVDPSPTAVIDALRAHLRGEPKGGGAAGKH